LYFYNIIQFLQIFNIFDNHSDFQILNYFVSNLILYNNKEKLFVGKSINRELNSANYFKYELLESLLRKKIGKFGKY